MSIYSKARTNITISTVCVSLGIIVGLWLLIFITDYLMFKNDMPILFSTTTIEEIEGKHITIETGLGYSVITNENNESELYVFGNKIK